MTDSAARDCYDGANMLAPASTIERVLRRDRVILVIALAALSLVSWVALVRMGSDTIAAATPGSLVMACCGVRWSTTFAMWIVMMVAMMLPTAAPMVLTHAAVVRRRVTLGAPYVATGLFVAGYLATWVGFSLIAATAQWGLLRASLLSAHTQAVAPWLGGAILVAAGLFQLTPAKQVCLSQCRAPLGFFMTEWRDGDRGAVAMGLRHGLYCVGCCWMLMALLFFAGVMNLLWAALLTAFVIAEKMLPWRRAIVWGGAGLCFAGGIGLIVHALIG